MSTPAMFAVGTAGLAGLVGLAKAEATAAPAGLLLPAPPVCSIPLAAQLAAAMAAWAETPWEGLASIVMPRAARAALGSWLPRSLPTPVAPISLSTTVAPLMAVTV